MSTARRYFDPETGESIPETITDPDGNLYDWDREDRAYVQREALSRWEVTENPDGSATLIHDGEEIGTIEEGQRRITPETLDSTGDRYVLTERRDYVIRGVDLSTADDSGLGLGTTLFSSSIGASAARRGHREVTVTMSEEEAREWYQARRTEREEAQA